MAEQSIMESTNKTTDAVDVALPQEDHTSVVSVNKAEEASPEKLPEVSVADEKVSDASGSAEEKETSAASVPAEEESPAGSVLAEEEKEPAASVPAEEEKGPAASAPAEEESPAASVLAEEKAAPAASVQDIEPPVMETKAIEKNLYLQYNNLEFSDHLMFEASINDYCQYTGVSPQEIESVDLYVKPEEGKAYYVINHDGEKAGSIDL